MQGRPLASLAAAAWIGCAALLVSCGAEREVSDNGGTSEALSEVAAETPGLFAGTYRVKGLTTDVARGDTRRIEGIVTLNYRGETYSASAELETEYPSDGGPVDAHVIGTGSGTPSEGRLRGSAETQLVMATVPGVAAEFAFAPRTVGPRLVSSWEAYLRRDGTLVVDLRNEPAEGEDYRPTTTLLYGTRIEEPEVAAEGP
jgi:hypothetical protein